MMAQGGKTMRTQLTGRVLGYRSVQVLAYVHDSIAANGQAPSYAMIRDQLGISSKAKVCEIVQRLERRGLLSRAGQGRVRMFGGWRAPVIEIGNLPRLANGVR